MDTSGLALLKQYRAALSKWSIIHMQTQQCSSPFLHGTLDKSVRNLFRSRSICPFYCIALHCIFYLRKHKLFICKNDSSIVVRLKFSYTVCLIFMSFWPTFKSSKMISDSMIENFRSDHRTNCFFPDTSSLAYIKKYLVRACFKTSVSSVRFGCMLGKRS